MVNGEGFQWPKFARSEDFYPIIVCWQGDKRSGLHLCEDSSQLFKCQLHASGVGAFSCSLWPPPTAHQSVGYELPLHVWGSSEP